MTRSIHALVLSAALLSACGAGAHRRPSLPNILENKEATHRVDILPNGHGSAVVLTRDGFLLTDHHVACEGGPKLNITIAEGDGAPVTHEARVVACDEENDLAVIKVDRTFEYAVALGDMNDLHEGDPVYNVGFPYFFGELVGRGYVMAKDYDHEDLGLAHVLVIDMPDGPGTSGSGIFDARSGKLVAVMRMMIWVAPPGRPLMVVRIGTQVDVIKKFLKSAGVPYETELPGQGSTGGSLPVADRGTPATITIVIVPPAKAAQP